MAFSRQKQKIFMVSGKGGVGKSVLAAALAQREAHRGAKTLLVELGDQSYFANVYNREIAYTPVEVMPNLSVAIWRGEDCLREYVLYLVKIKKIVDLFFDNRVMRTFVRAAPALKELAILGKITSGIRSWGPPLEYDSIVVDAFATGHFLALLKAPLGMAELVESGPMGEQTRQIHRVLSDPQFCEFWLATRPEELPVSEAIELYNELQKLMKQKSKVFCNMYYETDLTMAELSAYTTEAKANNLVDFAKFLKELSLRQEGQLATLKSQIASSQVLPMVLSARAEQVINVLESRLGDA